MRFSSACEASNARPIVGSATFATARLKFATVAARISAASTNGARRGPVDTAGPEAGVIVPTVPSCESADFARRVLDGLIDVARAHVELLGDALLCLPLGLRQRLLELDLGNDNER